MIPWPATPPVFLSTRALCLACEQFYEARHPVGCRRFWCPFCQQQTGVPVRG